MTKSRRTIAQGIGRRLDPNKLRDKTLLWRVCIALDLPPRNLALEVGVPFDELSPLLDDKHRLADMDYDEVWSKIAQYVDTRTGHIMALRQQLTAQLTAERTRRAGRHAMSPRFKRNSPYVHRDD